MQDQSRYSDSYVIVCGMPRSGTRHFTDLLAKHPLVCMQNEIGEAILRDVISLVLRSDAVYGRGGAGAQFAAKRREVLVHTIGLFSKGQVSRKGGCIIHGFKNPGAELMHEEINHAFIPSFRTIHYLFCIRNFTDCYLSLTSMPWFKLTREQYLSRYVKSLEAAVSMRHKSAASGDARFRVDVLDLDEFVSAESQAAWIKDVLFAPIGIDVPLADAEAFRISTKNTNSTASKFGVARPKDLTSDDYEYFSSRVADFSDAIQRFNLAFGARLSAGLG